MTLNRETEITWLGHATILVRTPGGKRLLIDPWTIGNPACPESWKDPAALGALDLVLVTHIHSDHVGDIQPVLAANPNAEVVGIFEACNWLQTKGAKSVRPMSKGGTQSVAGVQITMTDANHSSSFTEDDGTVIYGGEPAGYVLKLENGFTLYAAGDTGLFGDMALICHLYRPELAFLPIGDLFTMGPVQAAHAIRLLHVRHVVPIHYGTFPALTGTPEQLRDLTRDITGLSVHALKPGASLR
ncbi:MAG TPA: metal-dependent hydrolase [Chthonomonadaceae bacterium]|nr:metal-dependent hydrolase [Chthonomonadaceae bacterium]